MDESAALDTTAARAVESADRERVLWSDADREWASRAAAAVVGEGAEPEQFLSRRAQLVLERIGTRQPAVTRTVRSLRWRPWVGVVVVLAAFAFGVLVDRVGGGASINLLAPPVFALVAWNLLAYLWLLLRPLVLGRGAAGPLRGALIRLAALRGGLGDRDRADAATATRRTALAALPADWARVAAPLYTARAARVLHLAAAATALGVVAGLYTRGLAFEYRASWESTFLGAEQVRDLLAVTLAPGSWLTGIPVPDADALEAIRAPASENAASWMHLMAGTVAVVVILPRLVLALLAGLVERRRATRVPIPLDEPYYRRLIAGWVGEPTRVRVIPYSYTLAPDARSGLEALLARAYGNAVATVDPPVGWGDDAWQGTVTDAAGAAHVVVPLFSLTATPEEDAHGAFLDAVTAQPGATARRGAPATPRVVLVDESAFLARLGDDGDRREGRRAAWRELAEAHGARAVFVDLTDPDPVAEAELADAASGTDRAEPGAAR